MDDLSAQAIRVIDGAVEGVHLNIIEGDGLAKAILWSATGARFRSFHSLALQSGSQTIPLRHPTDCVYYVVEGQGDILDLNDEEAQLLGPGAMIHIDSGDGYRLRANAGEAMTVLGGPCPPDETLYAHLSVSGS